MADGFSEAVLNKAFPEPSTITLEEHRRRNLPEPVPEPRPKEEAA